VTLGACASGLRPGLAGWAASSRRCIRGYGTMQRRIPQSSLAARASLDDDEELRFVLHPTRRWLSANLSALIESPR